MAALLDAPLKDDLLASTADAIEAEVIPKFRADFVKWVGEIIKRVTDKPGNQGIMRNLPNSKDPVNDCALGAANICLLIFKEGQFEPSKGMPPEILPPVAAVAFLLALDVAEKAKIIDGVTNDDLDRGMKVQMERFMAALGWTNQKWNAMADELDRIRQDPAKVEILLRRGGTVRDPRASVPTDVPAEAAMMSGDKAPADDEEEV